MATTITGSGVDNIIDGTIVNADINASAGIVGSKLTGTGKVLQVVSNTFNTQSSVLYNATPQVFPSGFELSITPISTTSKILVSYNVCYGGPSNLYAYARLYKKVGSGSFSEVSGTSGIAGSANTPSFIQFSHSSSNEASKTRTAFGQYLDSPNTTSAVSYQLYGGTRYSTVNPLFINRSNSNGNLDYERPGVSTVTLMEIGG